MAPKTGNSETYLWNTNGYTYIFGGAAQYEVYMPDTDRQMNKKTK